MESGNESRPLLPTVSRTKRRNIFSKIPSEVTITGIILALFLIVVALLILLENLGSNSEEQLTLESNLLASPQKKSSGHVWRFKGKETSGTNLSGKKLEEAKNWLEEWRKSHQVGSTPTYNKKPNDKNWQNKKEDHITKLDNQKGNIPKKHFQPKNFQDFLKSRLDADEDLIEVLKKYEDSENLLTENEFLEILQDAPENFVSGDVNLLGSPFKSNKKIHDKSWEKKKDFVEFAKVFNTILSNAEKDWEDMLRTRDHMLKEMEEFYDAWQAAESELKSEMIKGKKLSNGCKQLSNRSVAAPTGCPFANTAMNSLQAAAITEHQLNCSLLAEQVRRKLGRCIDVSFLPKQCKPASSTKCTSSYKYRKIDGSCNNQVHPNWGKSGTPFLRMLAPDYGDGASSIRISKNKTDLPNARFLSHNLYSTKLKPDIDASLLFLSFGLMIDHDMVETAVNRDGIPCCAERFEKFPQRRPKECLEIEVPANDPFYGPRNVKCLNMVRSLPVHGECVGRREQLNSATSFLDGSTIYGSTIQKMTSLRSFNKGQLRTQGINNTPYMAFSEGTGFNCGTPSESFKCFTAGDSRVNMMVELTAMHTLWYREHNRVAEELHKINMKWNDETLFQEARRIVIAELQHITYNEFLPLLLGDEAMEFFQLKIEDDKYYDGYDDSINPTTFNVFGAAAFRFGHSLVQDMIDLTGQDNETEASIPLHETFFNPKILYHNGLDLLLKGAANQRLHSPDSFISKEIREHLFQAVDKDFGHDLAAVGIQRGRDHGLPGYSKWRVACGLPEIKSWDDLKSVMNIERSTKLEEVYQSSEDIDLIPGALAEDHVEGSLLGPTHLCIIGRQFRHTRKGDRLWFEMQDEMGSFRTDQLKQIYKSNLARIVCDNSDNIQKIQKFPFRVPSAENPVIKCEEHSKVDLSKWKTEY